MIHLFKLLIPQLCFLSLAEAYVNRLRSPRSHTPFFAVGTEPALSLSLRKPLGLILEEVEEGKAAGVYVAGLAEAGSALEYANQLEGAKLSSVQGTDVSRMDFDSVMDYLVNAPETVDLQFFVSKDSAVDEYAVGTPVTIKFLCEGRELEMKAAVGDNLRKVMLNNGVEVYQGMKQKLGNCGGGGTCTFCAVDIIESEGWAERSEYEDQKLAKFPGARLACLNSIQGPAIIQKTKR
jgi:ferredoxin